MSDPKSSLNPGWPESVGISAMEIYFPKLFVDQSELEKFDGVSSGKYTIGLGQLQMGVVSDREDVNSVAMTVVAKLFRNYELDPSLIGRVEVGTETLLDKSKSIKTILMPLLNSLGVSSGGNPRPCTLHGLGMAPDVEGCDCLNACYGGTQALFNAVNWLESSEGSGRTALVIMCDVAVYAPGPARCTGGAGGCALLLSANDNPPIVVQRRKRAFHMRHVWDFYKPRGDCEYPVVDGPQTLVSFNTALYECYGRFREKVERVEGAQTSLSDFAGVLMHSPFSRLVQKGVCRLAFDDFSGARCRHGVADDAKGQLEPFLSKPWSQLMSDKPFEQTVLSAFDDVFQKLTAPTLIFSRRVGNMYTPSVYASLGAFIASRDIDALQKSQLLLFSYGSGSAAVMYSLQIDYNSENREKLARIQNRMRDAVKLLDERKKVTPVWFTVECSQQEKRYGKAPFEPTVPVSDLGEVLFPNTYYLEGIDEKYRRTYAFYEG